MVQLMQVKETQLILTELFQFTPVIWPIMSCCDKDRKVKNLNLSWLWQLSENTGEKIADIEIFLFIHMWTCSFFVHTR